MSNKLSIPDQLRAAAVEIDGQWWVRSHRAMMIAGLSTRWCGELPKRGISCLRRPGHSGRVEVYLSLEGLLRFLRSRRTIKHHLLWTSRDDQRLAQLLRTSSIAKVARVMGRTLRAVYCRVERLGGVRAIWNQHHRLVSSGQLMRLVRKQSHATIRRWRGAGLPCIKAGSRGDTLFDLRDVRSFLFANPILLITLDPAARRLLRVTTRDIEAQRPGRVA